MRVAIATVRVPFTQGGAEILAQSLKTQLVARGHNCDIVSLPFKWYPPETLADCMLMGRMLDLTQVNGERIHAVIALKFPAYYTRHDNKVLWLLHQHRQAYDLWGTDFGDLHAFASGAQLRRLIIEHDTRYLAEARGVFTISGNVSRRLQQYNGLSSTPLYHPPAGHDQYRCNGYEPFVFYPGRIERIKRQRLLVEAARYLKSSMRIVIAGRGSESETKLLADLIREYDLSDRVTLAGYISEEQKRDLYARCRAVFFGGFGEDYGYVPLEAFCSAKPVIALDDTGGALEFVEDNVNGFTAVGSASVVADCIDRLGDDERLAEKLGQAGAHMLAEKRVDWDHVISSLLRAANA